MHTENCVFDHESGMIAVQGMLPPHLAHRLGFSRTSGTSLYPWKPLVVGTKLKLTTICLLNFFSEKEYSGRARWEELLDESSEWLSEEGLRSVFVGFRFVFTLMLSSFRSEQPRKEDLPSEAGAGAPGRVRQGLGSQLHLQSPPAESAWASLCVCFQGYIYTISKIKC